MRGALRFLALGFIAATIGAGSAQAASFACRETPLTRFPATLASIAPKIAGGRTLSILAIGSSSTEGIGASSKDKTYPARLKVLLGQAWPNVAVDIVNAGIGGEIAPETLSRLKQAMTERRYDLVIWQVGTNDAVNGGDLDAFRTMIADGIATVRQAGPGLVMLDPQFFPGIREPERYRSFVDSIADVGRRERVPVLSRYDAMREWYRDDAAAFTGALSGDGFHMSDAGYDCLARDMAVSIVGMAKAAPALVAGVR